MLAPQSIPQNGLLGYHPCVMREPFLCCDCQVSLRDDISVNVFEQIFKAGYATYNLTMKSVIVELVLCLVTSEGGMTEFRVFWICDVQYRQSICAAIHRVPPGFRALMRASVIFTVMNPLFEVLNVLLGVTEPSIACGQWETFEMKRVVLSGTNPLVFFASVGTTSPAGFAAEPRDFEELVESGVSQLTLDVFASAKAYKAPMSLIENTTELVDSFISFPAFTDEVSPHLSLPPPQ